MKKGHYIISQIKFSKVRNEKKGLDIFPNQIFQSPKSKRAVGYGCLTGITD